MTMKRWAGERNAALQQEATLTPNSKGERATQPDLPETSLSRGSVCSAGRVQGARLPTALTPPGKARAGTAPPSF